MKRQPTLKIISFLAAEIFLFSSVLPVSAFGIEHQNLRPSASDGANRSNLAQELRKGSALDAEDGGTKQWLGWPTDISAHPSEETLRDASKILLNGKRGYSRNLQRLLRQHARRYNGFTLLRIEPIQLERALNQEREVIPKQFNVVSHYYRTGDRFAPIVIGGLNQKGTLFIIDGNHRAVHAMKSRIPIYAYVGNSVLRQVKETLGKRPEKKWWARHRQPHKARAFSAPEKEKQGGTSEARDRGDQARLELSSYEALLNEVLKEVAQRRGQKGGGQFWIGVNGVGGSGKTRLAKELASRLKQQGVHSLWLSEDLWVIDRPTRNEWEQEQEPRFFRDWNWVRWPELQEALGTVRAISQGTARLKGLYNRSEGGRTNLEIEEEIFPDTVVVYDGMYLANPERYPPGSFGLFVFLDIPNELSLDRMIERDLAFGRSPEDTEKLFRLVYDPSWNAYVENTHPKRRADLVYDMTDFERPARLLYGDEARDGGERFLSLPGAGRLTVPEPSPALLSP